MKHILLSSETGANISQATTGLKLQICEVQPQCQAPLRPQLHQDLKLEICEVQPECQAPLYNHSEPFEICLLKLAPTVNIPFTESQNV